MAPIDRREHRQQRVRGAGPSAVQASFGFNFGTLPSKQSSLPPRRSSRQTPVRDTPRSSNGSAKRYRSASVQRSGRNKPRSTPKDQTITPQLGKRKRGSVNAREDDEEADELSPDRVDDIPSIEKSRRVVGTVSPIREENDDLQDELSMLGDERTGSATRKLLTNGSRVNGTPASAIAARSTSSGTGRARTPIADRIGAMTMSSRRSITRRSKSIEPNTPSLLPNGRPRLSSASRFGAAFDTPGAAPANEESEDELSPPQINSATPRVVGTAQSVVKQKQDDITIDLDELSSPAQQSTIVETPKPATVSKQQHSVSKKTSQTQPAKTRQPRRVIEDEDDAGTAIPAAAEPTKPGRPPKNAVGAKSKIVKTPATKKPSKVRPARKEVVAPDNVEEDELSPEKEYTTTTSRTSTKSRRETVLSDDEVSDEYEEELEELEPTPRRPAKRKSPKPAKPTNDEPPQKRHKFLGPKQAISVMRLKGSSVRGITVADTTRDIVMSTLDNMLSRRAEKVQNIRDSTKRKELSRSINLGLSFKESLEEKLLDVQDANDVLTLNMKKMKLFKRDNAELRKDILALQNNRQEIAIEHDNIQMEYEAEKAKVDARNTLSADMFDIEAAIQNGRERARRLGREDEGPEIPLPLMLDMVGRDVGSRGGGLLTNVKGFNGLLERAAGWLEGRV